MKSILILLVATFCGLLFTTDAEARLFRRRPNVVKVKVVNQQAAAAQVNLNVSAFGTRFVPVRTNEFFFSGVSAFRTGRVFVGMSAFGEPIFID